MSKELNMLGVRYNRLVGLEKLGQNKHRKRLWRFQCDCGNTHVVTAEAVKRGAATSCGCQRINAKKLPNDGGSFNQLFTQYEQNAKTRQIEFCLTRDEFRYISCRVCEYCGSEPKEYRACNRKTDVIACFANGIDRVDNSVGYVFGNCVACCSLCNYMKRALSVNDFLNHIKKISSLRLNDAH